MDVRRSATSVTAPALAPRQRRQLVREYVLANGSASPAELARHFRVSLMTVHRDLSGLEQEGVVRTFRGGVTAQPSAVFESNFAYRLKAMQTEKDIIALQACRHIEPGMAILLDDSTTSLALARHLGDMDHLTVVTNHLETLKVLSQLPALRLVALGGDYDPKYNAFMGMSCVEAIEKIRVDVAFLSTYGVSDGYAYHQDQHMVTVKRAMLASSERRALMVDHTKVGRVALHQVCALSTFNVVIVDEGTPIEALKQLDESKVVYEVAKLPATSAPRSGVPQS